MKYDVNYYRSWGEYCFVVYFPELRISTIASNLKEAKMLARELLLEFLAGEVEPDKVKTRWDYEQADVIQKISEVIKVNKVRYEYEISSQIL